MNLLGFRPKVSLSGLAGLQGNGRGTAIAPQDKEQLSEWGALKPVFLF